jgi:hypothetical protein
MLTPELSGVPSALKPEERGERREEERGGERRSIVHVYSVE